MKNKYIVVYKNGNTTEIESTSYDLAYALAIFYAVDNDFDHHIQKLNIEVEELVNS